jgi:hypothetical protein
MEFSAWARTPNTMDSGVICCPVVLALVRMTAVSAASVSFLGNLCVKYLGPERLVLIGKQMVVTERSASVMTNNAS